MGQIRKRGKYYQIRFYNHRGERVEESTGYTRWDDARDLLRKREHAVSDGVPITPASTRFTFDEAVKAVIADYMINGRKSTAWLERRITLHLTPIFGGRRLSNISSADIRSFMAARLHAGAAAAEVNREIAIIRRAFRLAVKSETYSGRVPAFSMIEERNVRTGFLDRDAFEALRNHLPAALQPVITFGFLCGWRIRSEVLPLEWRQVDREARTVRLDVGTTKNARGRHIDYSALPELVALFDEQWRLHEALQKAGTICPWVFHRDGKRIKDFRGAWDQACTAAGLAGRVPHDLRRTAVRNLVRAGVPDTVAMKITGHLTREVFDRYDITSDADLRAGLGRLHGATGTNSGDKTPHASRRAKQQSA